MSMIKSWVGGHPFHATANHDEIGGPMSTYRLRKILPFMFVIAVLVMVISLYVGYIFQPQNDNLSKAGSFAGATGATVGILVAAFAIYLEQKRSEERHDEANAAWAACARLRAALLGVGWTTRLQGELGHGVSAQTREGYSRLRELGMSSEQGSSGDTYLLALRELEDSLNATIVLGGHRVLGVVWDGTRSSPFNGGSSGIVLLLELRGHVKHLVDERIRLQNPSVPDARGFAQMAALFEALGARDIRELDLFRETYETSDPTAEVFPNRSKAWPQSRSSNRTEEESVSTRVFHFDSYLLGAAERNDAGAPVITLTASPDDEAVVLGRSAPDRVPPLGYRRDSQVLGSIPEGVAPWTLPDQ